MAKNRPWDDRWERGKRLGKGGQGLTFLTRKKGEAEFRYVLKVLKDQKEEERRVRMRIEAAALEFLSGHEGIAPLVDTNAEAYRSEDELFIVSEFVEGAHPEGPMGFEQAATIAIRLLEILEYCHGEEYVHRDIKPDNVILRDNDPEDPVLLDFGLSFNKDHAGSFQTAAGQNIGPRNFIDLPELTLASSNKRDLRTDVTQVLAVLFFCLTGESPGPLQDAQGHKPHERSVARTALEKLPDATLRGLRRLFEIGFNQRVDSRWENATVLKNEIRELISPSRPLDLEVTLVRDLEDYISAPDIMETERIGQLYGMIAKVMDYCMTIVKKNANHKITVRRMRQTNSPTKRVFRDSMFLQDLVQQVQVKLAISDVTRIGGELSITVHTAPAGGQTKVSTFKIPFEDPDAENTLRQIVLRCMQDAIRMLQSMRKEAIDAAATAAEEADRHRPQPHNG